ncbi:FAD-dependent oxidoreductase [Bradyrhizobium sp. sBnM-33]|uniref:FAD-dependent oxidoreductase n=1 Tax=Bradyrhizobium sp. sBnM-33 TaxID=2831780 RepID=UPI001BCAE6C7|nr:FAD-dependent oxidoreductase [Bradyrhizobium sp. sBnM-33]WOH47129.1 NAD(P)-binding domain-containing protein [Bradyrhizobium sp. sBnM-33]
MSEAKKVAIIGAGPVGLAAAAHMLERGLQPIVLEAGDKVGHAMQQWGHVQLFSPWEYNVDKAAARLLAQAGWNSPEPDQYPTGMEMVEHYLEPLAANTALKPHIQTSSRVTAISRAGFDKMKTKGREKAPFEIRYQNGQGPKVVKADAIIDASGTWHSPNPAGANGLSAIGESDISDRIAYGMPDVLGKERARYAGKTVAVLGAGHSAIGTLIDLAKLAEQAPGTRPIWLLRGSDPAKAFGGGANDKLVARGELGAAFAGLVTAGRIKVESEFRVSHLIADGPDLVVGALSGCGARQAVVDELIVATGFRPDLDFVRELRIRLDPAIECPVALAPLIDPNEHSCGTVRPHGARELAQDEPGFYFAGMKAYGRAPTFLMLTGYEQVRSIAADIAGDRAAAERVELVLPETGVCSRSLAPDAGNCCGGPALSDVDACCVADEKAKQQGKTGCGCAS